MIRAYQPPPHDGADLYLITDPGEVARFIVGPSQDKIMITEGGRLAHGTPDNFLPELESES